MIGSFKEGKIFTEFTLMCVATICAAILGEFADAATVMFLYSLGEKISDSAYARSKKNLSSLLEVTEEKVALGRSGDRIVRASEVLVGDDFLVRVGEKIALDGVVIEGQGFVDTAAITGESVPRELTKGDKCLSGCTLISGSLVVRAENLYEDSTENRMKEAVKNAAARKAKTEKRITKFASVFTPIAFALTLGVVLIGYFGFDLPLYDAVKRGLVILVSSCPCSLVLSIPLAYFAGLGLAAGRGILFRGGETVDNVAKLRTVLFDKTGTLTSASLKFEGVEMYPECPYGRDELLSLCRAALVKSPHAAARSFCADYHPSVDYEGRVEDAENIGGKGLVCLVDGKKAAFGNPGLMAQEGVTVPPVGKTAIYVLIDRVLCGVLIFFAGEKENAAKEIARLRKLGVDRMVILSGDNREAVAETAGRVGLSEYFAELLPDEKLERTEYIYKEEKKKDPAATIAFCGDGLNDSAVIARADVGIAMGSGSAVTVDTADAVIVDDNLERVGDMIRISNRIVRIAGQNIAISLGIKLAVILVGLFLFQSLEMAVVADVGAAVITVLNALRAGKMKF